MEKLARVGASIVFAVGLLAGCRIHPRNPLTDDQQSDLDGYTKAYHLCVARMAGRIDDGTSPVTAVTQIAMGYCGPRMADLMQYLSTLPLSQSGQNSYLRAVRDEASRHCALMLRDRRTPNWRPLKL